ncbi:MAG: IS1182 family transposase [Sandaracinaceae bacterium]
MRWTPPRNSARERKVAARLRRASRFYKFLWEIRRELFEDGFEDELLESYEPRGQDPCPPALLAMVCLLQRYDGLSDADAVDSAENDRRWQLVLGTLGRDEAPFGQGTLVRFRTRMITHDLDKKLVDRTVELAKKTGGFGWKNVRVALDSSPLHGAGRVEDTWNLIGRSMSKVVHAVSLALGVDENTVVHEAKLTVLSADSVKAALDVDWDDESAQSEALNRLLKEVSALEAWVAKKTKKAPASPPLTEALKLLRTVVEQDTEPDPPKKGARRIKEGVPPDRVISVSDPQMRHGRKSRTKLFNGYKRHVAVVERLIVATAVEPANVREHEPAARLLEKVREHGAIETLDIDRGYLASPAVEELHRAGATVNSRAWQVSNRGLFTKADFKIDLAKGVVRCPGRKTAPITRSKQVFFREQDCGPCKKKTRCTTAPKRSLTLHAAEDLLIKLRREKKTPGGRSELRKRVAVEHRLARVGAIQGTKARYRGARKNELDLNRTAAVANLFEVARRRCA